MKTVPGRKPQRDIEQAVRDLVGDSVASDGVVDIFKTAGLERTDVSILDDNFLQTYKDRPYEDLRLKLLQRLLADAIEAYRKRNPFKAQSFKELLEATPEISQPPDRCGGGDPDDDRHQARSRA